MNKTPNPEQEHTNVEKYIILWLIGGTIYALMETLFRGYTHWTMVILGGICFICMGLINEFLSWDTPVVVQMLIGSIVTTTLEFATGCIVNIWLEWNIWDYSDMPLNLFGQICLPYSILWFFISFIGITLDDHLRYKFFKEEKPRYKLF